MTADHLRTEWDRAIDAFRDAQVLLTNGGFDSAASRAYYAAFHAVTALFALEGRIFARHSALEAAVHRDLVKAGRWSADLGRDFSLCEFRVLASRVLLTPKRKGGDLSTAALLRSLPAPPSSGGRP